ncbi:putative SWI/SNF-related matrix-associated actin-dependent regulator [Paratrimastix pyriformis]|uniref:SWI/SNF-related matrix-associated actin-dependent regulator n=1 Tax=Paratrimastix pyriformis TaxID=342808 RepID=A0ABQ8USZ5_9EUKA|nr:putative SWI/SNF-related matrix-associated actin-dependent regulator [Paratrimastix pyriformis]
MNLPLLQRRDFTEFVDQSLILKQLFSFEKKIDLVMAKQQLSLPRLGDDLIRELKTIHLSVYNTYANQPGFPSPADVPGQTPSWTLHIRGTISDSVSFTKAWLILTWVLLGGAVQVEGSAGQPSFTSLVERLMVQWVRDDQEGLQAGPSADSLVEWVRPALYTDTDGFQITRTGQTPLTARCTWPSARASTSSPQLSAPAAAPTRGGLQAAGASALMRYIKERGLCSPDDPAVIAPDPALARLWEMAADLPQTLACLPRVIERHLLPLDPLEITYRIRLTPEGDASEDCYQLHFETDAAPATNPFSRPQEALGAATSPALQQSARQLQSLTQSLARTNAMMGEVFQHIQTLTKRREYLLAFAADPARFLAEAVDAQAHDFKLAQGALYHTARAEREGSVFYQPWVFDAVSRYLARAQRLQQAQAQASAAPDQPAPDAAPPLAAHPPPIVPAPSPQQQPQPTLTPPAMPPPSHQQSQQQPQPPFPGAAASGRYSASPGPGQPPMFYTPSFYMATPPASPAGPYLPPRPSPPPSAAAFPPSAAPTPTPPLGSIQGYPQNRAPPTHYGR